MTFRYDSPIGLLALTTDGTALTGLRFEQELRSQKVEEWKSQSVEESISTFIFQLSTSKVATLVCRWLDCYFSGHCPDFLPPLALQGTPFQCRVWQALMDIPYGATITYGALALRVGCRSAQAVGQAVGRNPVAIIVPCHRVVGGDGSLTGYAYGLERKEYLLRLESTVS
jgi:methylated-DNA-[protein]-cysteine S-methyltransferase